MKFLNTLVLLAGFSMIAPAFAQTGKNQTAKKFIVKSCGQNLFAPPGGVATVCIGKLPADGFGDNGIPVVQIQRNSGHESLFQLEQTVHQEENIGWIQVRDIEAPEITLILQGEFERSIDEDDVEGIKLLSANAEDPRDAFIAPMENLDQ